MVEYEFEEKYLDEMYLLRRFQEIDDVRNGKIKVYVQKSDNYPRSVSLYVTLDDGETKQRVLRVSDHVAGYRYTQFIITPGKVLTKKKKDRFNKILRVCVVKFKQTKRVEFYNKITRTNII